ncbi:MAG: immunity 26/phosphotriesterase HocA family protein [Ignavibacteriales bacterium]|nr:immunity 26/phosphotriesterase HocA family protein [Ignavibacteriales bacterium]
MARQRKTPGAILEIKIDDEYYCYAQTLQASGTAFFDYHRKEKLKDISSIVNLPVLFIVAVYNDIITQGHWLKVGKLEIRDDLKVPPMEFIQDMHHPEKFELYDPNTGAIIPATKEECRGLEICAVWDQHHVEQRLSDYYAGRPNYLQEKYRKIVED